MGEGVTNPVDSTVEGPSVLWAACLKLVLLVGLSYVVALRWRRKKRDDELNPDAIRKEDDIVSLREENSITSLTGHTGPHLRRSVSRGIVSQLQTVAKDMEQNARVPSDPQPDSFFTWDSGSNSGDYSFVHTAVELPKYPNGTITEEERQMLLLYMQSGHPELLLSSASGVMDNSLLGTPASADAVMCDQVSVRGYLETIVEENSDDLISPSDCDEASVGWGSWDESDDDRVTVVEMETNNQNDTVGNYNGIKQDSNEQNSVSNQASSKKEKLTNSNGNKFPSNLERRNVHTEENELDCYDLADKQLLSLTGATSGNDCAFENSSLMCVNKFCDNCAEYTEVSDRNVKVRNDFILDTKPKVSPKSYDDSDFENLWLSASNVNNSNAEPFKPWSKNDYSDMPSSPQMRKIDFNVNNCNNSPGDKSFLVLGSDELCLVPSGMSNSDAQNKEEKLMFSDDFKDYFLSPDSDTALPNINDKIKQDNISIDTDLSDSNVRCFRIGFESEAHELVNDDYYNSEKKSSPVNSETEYSENNDVKQETLFSPRDGDVVYGSSWVSDRIMKKPEKNSSSAETQFSNMHSESPPVDNNRKSFHLSDQSASDDECQEVSNSLSRWQHHTDLQHLQEATSPITRWQHQNDLLRDDLDQEYSKQTYSDEDTDDGLPPQLKQIYSSFKMKDNKMGRIRIKEDKNNNFKKIGLWDNEAKVTLPPFIANHNDNINSQTSEKTEIIKEEEFDDLQFDMFSVNKKNIDKSDHLANADPDIDDALKSFNHLDDYSSNSEENSESENSYTVNTVENIDYENEDLSAPSTPDMPSLKNDSLNSCINEHIKSENENTCSDNSDNCPLCTDPSFKNSKIDIFSNASEEKFLDNNVQSLLLNTYPKIKTLAQENNVPRVDENGDSISPLTSSDSDEGIRTAKDVKKRIKRRSKDSSSTVELKHDDSGYVEDDEDDDEDDILEEKTNKDSILILSSGNKELQNNKGRKSLSSVFYESKSMSDLPKPNEMILKNFYESKSMSDLPKSNEIIPKSFEEFSCYLQQSVLAKNVKDGVIVNEKLNVSENLSQFSSLLLDTELKKISCRDEMEKLIVNDILSLKEQTVAQFLKDSNKEDMSKILLAEESKNKNLIAVKGTTLDVEISQKLDLNSSDENFKDKPKKNENIYEQIVQVETLHSSEKQDDQIPKDIIDHISGELDIAYTNCNLNSQVEEINLLSNETSVKNADINNKTAPLSELPDVISDVIKIKTETKENASHMFTPSDQEVDEIKQKKIRKEADHNDSLFGNQNIHTGINAEINPNEKQKLLSKHQHDSDDTEFVMQAKVICTTASVTSDKELVTNNTETVSLMTYSAINNSYDKLATSDVCEVTPSVEEISNYKNIENAENHIITDNSEITNLSLICVKEAHNNHNIQNECIPSNNNDSSFAECKTFNKNSISSDEYKILPNDYRVENVDVIQLEKKSDEICLINHEAAENNRDLFNNTSRPFEVNENSREVAPSSADALSEQFVAPENKTDLMISRTLEEKGAYQGFSIENISPPAEVVSKEVDSAEHVTGVDYLAYDELACVTRPILNDNLCALPTSDADALSDNANIVNEKVQSSPIVSLEVPEELNICEKNSNKSFTEQSSVSSDKDILSSPIEKRQISENVHDSKILKSEIVNEKSKIVDNCQSSNLYKSKSVIVLQTEDFEENDKEDEFTDSNTNCNNSESVRNLINLNFKSVNNLNTVSNVENNCSKDLSKIKSSDDLCILSNKEKIKDIREEYKRSRSVGREDNEKEAETFDSWNGQSKSTPDLSRCHDQQLNSSIPLSALLSKRVSERIQDYLGKSSRENILNRSLPPSERSRHYRRICVSTETVVERAARFEARSKSTGRDSSVESVSSRSGSCPPSNMRTGDTKFVRGYSKPVATVRPTIDIYRNSFEYDGKMVNGSAKKSEEDLFELITGYKQATKVTHKPPVPPTTPSIQQSLRTCKFKGKIASARKEFFEKLSQQEAKSKAEFKTSLDVDVDGDTSCELRRFNEFRKSAREERARLAQSHPDLGALEAAVRSSRRRIDQLKKRRQNSPPLDAGPRPSSDADMPGTTTTKTTKDGTLVLPYRRCTGEIAWASCAKRLQEAKSRSISKSQEPLEIVDERQFKRPAERALLRAHDYENAADEDYEDPGPAISGSDFSRARSMDFLLDNREGAEPPENRLAQRVKSEHELRIERSLQNLTLPDWYTQSKKPKEGFILRRSSEGSAGESRKRWLGFSSSRTPSATSLTTPPSSYSQRNIIIPKRVTPTSGEWRYFGSLVSSRESLTPASPASLSPRECSSAAFNYGLNSSLSRWSSSRLSTSSAPLSSSVHRSFRQPYLGWRAAAASSGGPSRSSPGVSPLNATTPLQGSRPGSPRRGSQDHHYGYGLQQNQITSAATLRPEGGETDSGSRISPLALYDNSTNVFFNSNIEVPEFSTPEMRRDRYSYTQSLYSGTVIVSPGTEFKPVPSIAEDSSSTTDDRFSMSRSPQPPPRIWMESSFVGTKKDGKDQVPFPQGRTIRIVPSDSVRSGSSSSVRSTCAPQTTMDTRELIDHLHNFLRGLQNRNQMIRPSSNSAFTPVSSSSNSGFHQDQTTPKTTHETATTSTTTTSTTTHEDSPGSRLTSTNLNTDQRQHLVNYDAEPKAYPRSSWRHSSSSSKDISPDNSSTDNELWLSVGEEMATHSFSRTTPEHLDARSSSRSSISPTSPPVRYQQQQKRASEDSTGSTRPIFFASSRRGSKGSNYDPRNEPSLYQPSQYSSNITDSSQNREELSRKSSSTHSEESGVLRRDSKSGGSNSWKDSRTDQESSSASKAEKSSASMEEVLESLLAIPPSNSRSSSPTSPRRARGHFLQHLYQQQQSSKMFHAYEDSRTRKSEPEVIRSQPASSFSSSVVIKDPSQKTETDVEPCTEAPADDQGKIFDASLNFPPFPSSSTSTNQPLFPLEEVNHGSFCRSSSTSLLEDDVHSPTSMEVLVPEGEEQDLSSIIEDGTNLTEDFKFPYGHHFFQPLQQATMHECQHHRRPPLRRQSTLPSCSSNDPLSQPQEEEFRNLFAGLQTGSYSRGLAERPLRRPQSLCLVLLHLPCMFCARALAPPPHTINSFSHVPPTRETCVSEPGTPARDSVCSFEPGPCCGDPVVVGDPNKDFCLTNVDSNPGRGPSTHEETGTASRKKTTAVTEGHLKCHRPRCNKSLPAEEARVRFRTCPNCYTYYCSRQCRKLHLARHKDHCPQTRISNLCKQVLMKARDDPVSRRHLSLCARRGLLSRGRGAVKLLFLCPEDANDYLVNGWETTKGQTLYVARSDLLPQEMGSEVFSQVRNFCDKYNPERKFILLAAITVTNDIAQALNREIVVRGAKMHLSPSLPEDDVQTLILTISKTDPQTGDPIESTTEDRRKGLSGIVEQLSARGVDVEKLYPHTYRKIIRFVEENEPFNPISIFPTDQRSGRVFMCIILPWADADIIANISTKGGAGASKSAKKKWML